MSGNGRLKRRSDGDDGDGTLTFRLEREWSVCKGFGVECTYKCGSPQCPQMLDNIAQVNIAQVQRGLNLPHETKMAGDFARFDQGRDEPTGCRGIADALPRHQNTSPGERATCELLMAPASIGVVFFETGVVRVRIPKTSVDGSPLWSKGLSIMDLRRLAAKGIEGNSWAMVARNKMLVSERMTE